MLAPRYDGLPLWLYDQVYTLTAWRSIHSGGWVKCQMEGCKRRGKSRGLCWSHGGGTKCSRGDCSKVAVSNSLCWAHGGGKRCVFEGCKKAAYERNHNFCSQHIAQRQQDPKTEETTSG